MNELLVFGMYQEQAEFLYKLVQKEIETIDIALDKMKGYDGLDWLQNRRKIAEDTKSLLSWIFT